MNQLLCKQRMNKFFNTPKLSISMQLKGLWFKSQKMEHFKKKIDKKQNKISCLMFIDSFLLTFFDSEKFNITEVWAIKFDLFVFVCPEFYPFGLLFLFWQVLPPVCIVCVIDYVKLTLFLKGELIFKFVLNFPPMCQDLFPTGLDLFKLYFVISNIFVFFF